MTRVLPRLVAMLAAGLLISFSLFAALDLIESTPFAPTDSASLRWIHLARGWGVACLMMAWGAFSMWMLGREDRALLERTLETRTDSLAQERAFSECLLRDSRDAFLVWNREGFIEHASPSTEALFGWSEGELRGKPLRTLLDRRHHAAYDRRVARAGRGATSESANGRPITLIGARRDGSTFALEMAPYEATLAGRSVVASMLRDVTERQEAERARRRSESLRAVMEALPDVVVVHRDRRLVYVNRRFLDLLGFQSQDEILGRSIRDLIHPDDWDGVSIRLRELELRGKTTEYAEERFVRADGGAVTLEVAKVPVVFDSRAAVVAIGRDVSQRRLAERRFRQAVESAPSGMIMADAEGRIVLANSHVEGLFGYRESELLGEDIETLLPDRYRPMFPELRDAYLADPRVRPIGGPSNQIYGLHRDGNEIPVEVGLNPLEMDDGVFILCSVVDLRERKRVETLVGLADRMTTVGTLAAGVAHGINNPLAYVKGNLQFVISELRHAIGSETDTDGSTSDVLRALEQAIEGSDRIRDTVRDLLTYARKEDTGKSEGVDLNDLLDSIVQMTKNELRHRARVEKNYSTLPPVVGDTSRLAHAITNLVVNAAHAVPEGRAAEESVRISTFYDSTTDRVVLEITDTGCGMQEGELQRAFEPFYTTKPVGMGVGLGLSVTHGIVTSIGGTIELESAPGVGTKARVTLPRFVVSDSETTPSEPAVAVERRRTTSDSRRRRRAGRPGDARAAASRARGRDLDRSEGRPRPRRVRSTLRRHPVRSDDAGRDGPAVLPATAVDRRGTVLSRRLHHRGRLHARLPDVPSGRLQPGALQTRRARGSPARHRGGVYRRGTTGRPRVATATSELSSVPA